MRTAPSIKSLTQIRNVDREKAKRVRGVIKGEIRTRSFASVERWIRQCYHEPKWSERAMCAINEIIGGHGVESINNRRGDPFIDYVNLGDTYDATVVYYIESGNFYVRSWGDVVEANRL